MTGPSETTNATTEKVELLKPNISTPISNGNSSAHQENGILINKMDKRGENKNLTETIEVSGNATKKAGQPEEVADSGASASKPQIIKTMESRLETLNNTSGLESPKNETSTQTSIPSSSPSTSTEKVEANKPTPPPENTSEQQLSTKIPQALNETETIAPTIKSVNDSMSNSTINTKKDKPMLPVSDGENKVIKV
jgi:hypothetical protein